MFLSLSITLNTQDDGTVYFHVENYTLEQENQPTSRIRIASGTGSNFLPWCAIIILDCACPFRTKPPTPFHCNVREYSSDMLVLMFYCPYPMCTFSFQQLVARAILTPFYLIAWLTRQPCRWRQLAPGCVRKLGDYTAWQCSLCTKFR
jgi:hypothetical protein